MKKYLSLILCAALICALFTGCGGSDKTAATMAAPMEEMAQEEPAAMDNGAMLKEETGAGNTANLPQSRKWIITVHMSAETEDLDAMTRALEEKIAAMNGFVEDQSVYNGSSYSNRRYRNASLTIRVPAESVDQFTEAVAGISNVVNKEKTLEDVTLQYSSTETRVEALRTEEARLLELMAKAETMADLLEIEARLTDVRYELENHASRLRLYDNQIDFATIYLSINEVQEYTPVEEPTFWERITGGFGDSIESLWESLQDMVIMVIVLAPFLLVYGGIAAVIVVLLRKLSRRRKERKLAKKHQEPPKQEQA